MYGSRTTPGLFSFTRSTALFFSVWASLSSGSNYVVGAYLPQLGARLHLSHTKLNVFAVAGNIGVYMSGPFLGKIVDARGPRPLLIAAFILLLSGYSGIRGIFDAGPGEGKDLSTLRLITLVFCSFFSGVGGHAGMASAMNTTAKNFPDHLRAVTVGLVMSGFGLSAFFFSSISHTLFPGNTSDFLLVLALGTAIPMIFGFFFVRIIPLPSHGATAVEAGSSSNYQPLATSADSDEHRHYGSRSKNLQYQSDVVDEGESREPNHESPSNSVELYPSSGFHSHDTPESTSHSIEEPQSKNLVEGRGVNLYRWTLWKSIDFWIMCSMHALLAGTGLMYINNAGSIAQALLAHRKPDYDEAESAIWQAAQVSAISLASFSGRILIGIVADMVKSRLRVPRSFCMPAMCALFILSQLLLVAIGDISHLWMASVLLGLGYGCWFGLLPTISIEWFGLAHFSENWGVISIFPVLGGNLFSIAFGRNLDAHEPQPEATAMPSPSANTRCLDGRGCYVQTLYLNIWACVIALGFSFWAGRRDWMHWQGRDQPRERMNTVVWEDTGEAVGPEDLEP
ncbi:MFS general substrate transporter [Russula emetica]|nr:MFS general substrate transporter [Russula emetica]